ncbi:MAG: GAF domain-containing protein [Gloeomargaritaceae cyanobacterium C42_A2020_066]|nr:GAF domain-containing protein [Gloeomargaritaceae cyanobacterium C42_A2020_066]
MVSPDSLPPDLLPQITSPTEQAWLHTVLGSIGDGVILTDLNCRVWVMNQAAEQLTGWSAEEAVGQPLFQVLCLVNARTHQPVEGLLGRVLREGVVTGLPRDTLLLSRSGCEYYLSATLAPLGHPPQIRGLIVTCRDVTRHRRLEDSLREQAERERIVRRMAAGIRQSLDLQTILETTVTEVRCFLHADRVMIHRFEGLGGTVVVEATASDCSSLLGQNMGYFGVAPQHLESLRQGQAQVIPDIFQSDLEAGQVRQLDEWRVRSSLVVPVLQQQDLWGLLVAHQCKGLRAWQLQDVELLEQLALQLGIAIDQAQLYAQLQTLNTSLEAQVRERTAELQEALDCAQVLKAVTDRVRDSLDEAQILQTAIQELGQALGTDYCWAALYDDRQTAATVAYEYLGPAGPTHLGLRLTLADYPAFYQPLLAGTPWLAPPVEVLPLAYQVLRGPEGELWIHPIRDDQGVLGELGVVTAGRPGRALLMALIPQVASQCAIAIRQARLYQAAQAQVVALERLSRLKDDFLSSVSHELRTPLSNMKMALKMLRLQIRPGRSLAADAGQRLGQYLDILEAEYHREANLIQDLLNLRHLETGAEPLHQTTVILQDWLPPLLERFRTQADRQSQRLRYQIDPDLPPLRTHPFSLERVLTELLTNACKYTPRDQAITLEATAGQDELTLTVSNTGVEISPEELPLIFERFYRIPRRDPWQYSGMGLGLALVRRLVTHLGGTIEARSSNQVTCFSLHLPMTSDLPAPAPAGRGQIEPSR